MRGPRIRNRLGRALAISLAAGDPRMGSLAFRPLAALLTVFSARPGSWIEKPRSDGWAAASPRFGDLPVAASLGLAGGGGDFLYLSGGADFERLGVYELIRRRCRYIVAVDADAGGAAPDAGLATLIRRCRIDFGLSIEIDARTLSPAGPDRLSSARVAIGRIHYEEADQGGMSGVLVYVWLSISDDEPPEMQQNARNEPRSRHRPPRFRPAFDDRQFECFRCLGQGAARAVFADVVTRLGAEFPDLARQGHVEFVPRLFGGLSR